MMLQGALNGRRARDFHPCVPISASELGADAAAAHRAGADQFHVHPRDARGRESLDAVAIGDAVSAIRAAVPGALVGVSTGEWIEADDGARIARIEAWSVRPDYASVNLDERDAPRVVETLLSRGIGVEAGLHVRADALRLKDLGFAARCLRILVEIGDLPEPEALAEAEAILATLRDAGIDRPILLHGSDASVWPMVRLAKLCGLDTRIGLEDGRTRPDGTIAADNAALVTAVRVI